MEIQEMLTQMRGQGVTLKRLPSLPVCLKVLSAGAARPLTTGFISFHIMAGFRADVTSAESALADL
ncbi:hypothetical protein [Pantoea agglomerans]|uniref:hypothetical protein n=1 Tax=Enterobacter agglomerans TaxID=549 RepID=UPI00053550B1|nr:hypothetical protein [Pantoea agglomerans]